MSKTKRPFLFKRPRLNGKREARYLREGLLVLDLAGPQQSEDVLGPLGHSVLHPVVVSQLLHAQLHATQVMVPCKQQQHTAAQLSLQAPALVAQTSGQDTFVGRKTRSK